MLHAEKPNEQATVETEEAHCNSILSPNVTEVRENPSGDLPASPVPLHTTLASSCSPGSSEDSDSNGDMANFAVNPEPFVPYGLEVEDWARPARGRIIISGNPPRRHEEYAIVSMHPPPQQQHLYEAMDEVVEYFEEEHHVRVESSCLSPLGLCLVQFRSPVDRQTMINMSPHQLDALREIIVVEHDRGINLRNCPFTRTCWIMFLAFPLDYQTRDIISQAVGHFGIVITWTNNTRCKSRLLLRCKVTLISRIPRSLLICEGNVIGDHGSSWSVPVFALNSQQTDEFPGDEDQIPPNGNSHLVNPHFLNENHN